MSFALFIVFKKIVHEGRTYAAMFSISKLSYGMYLVHYIILSGVALCFPSEMYLPLKIVLITVLTYISCYVVTKILSFLPGSKYIVG